MTAKKQTAEKPAAPKGAVIDRKLMEEAIRLRREERLSMEQLGARLGVKATAYLAKKIKGEFGDDALKLPPKVEQPAVPSPAAKAPAKKRTAKKAPAAA